MSEPIDRHITSEEREMIEKIKDRVCERFFNLKAYKRNTIFDPEANSSILLRVQNAQRITDMFYDDLGTYLEECFLFNYIYKRPASLNDFHLFKKITYEQRIQFYAAIESGTKFSYIENIELAIESDIYSIIEDKGIFDSLNIVADNLLAFAPPMTEYNPEVARKVFNLEYNLLDQPKFIHREVHDDIPSLVVSNDLSLRVKDSFLELPSEDVASDPVEALISKISDGEQKPEQTTALIEPWKLDSVLNDCDFDLVIYAPPGFGKTTFNSKASIYDSDFVSNFRCQPKILITNLPLLIKRGKMSIGVLSDFKTFRERVASKCGESCPFENWYTEIRREVLSATYPIIDNRFMSEIMMEWLAKYKCRLKSASERKLSPSSEGEGV